jgi:hypothetical protein
LSGKKVVQEFKSLFKKKNGNHPGFLDNHGGCLSPLKKQFGNQNLGA